MRIVGGIYRSRTLNAPKGMATRPTLDQTREALFNILQGRIADARFLDLFAGSGAVALEAVSRGAETAALCDQSRAACACIRENICRLGCEERTRLLEMPAERAMALLCREQAQFDLIFLDPPYAMTDLREVTEALLPLLAEEGMIVLEHQAEARIQTAEALEAVRSRSWGYCGVTFFRLKPAGEGESLRSGGERNEAKE